jgi:nitroimidazol reductase NimA-like FMN-containing flavoprotein (pyridoxamine 5'-phosphate oxidase superfamily)
MTQIRRHAERAAQARADLDTILDAGWVGTLAVVVDGAPQVVPVLYARDGDALLMHGSTGAGSLRAAGGGGPVAFCVSLLDGFVYAASLFESSANYRSAVVTGAMEVLDGDQARAALDRLSEHLMPGRPAEVRGHTAKEIAATVVLRLPIRDGSWTAKARTGSPGADEDADPNAWTGVLPLLHGFGAAVPTERAHSDGIPVPESVTRRIATGR